ncbi:glycerol-3-phosphate 1-O-acyltransferase PlsY [Verrucomicrobiota bacterium]
MFEPMSSIIGVGFLAYLVGAIPTGYLLAKIKGIDIRNVGSGNIGATNVYRCVGKSWGILTFVLDFLKGYLPAALFPLLIQYWTNESYSASISIIFGCLAVAGHNWPVYLRFRGGKGIATGAGALLGFDPLVMLIGIISWALLFLATRYVSVASMLATIIIAVSAWLLYTGNMLIPIMLTIASVIIIWRHRSNLRRLLAGTEYRFKFRKD